MIENARRHNEVLVYIVTADALVLPSVDKILTKYLL